MDSETIIKQEKNEKTVKSLSVVMPVYNEGENIYRNLLQASHIIGRFAEDYEIIAVNDGSTDNSLEEIRRAMKEDDHIRVVYYDVNHGKGYAVKLGMMTSTKTLTAFCDSDLELTPKMLKSYARAMKQSNADIVIGSKMHKNSKVEYPFIRKIISWGYYIFLKVLFKLSLKDTQTGIKLYKTEALKEILKNVETEGFSFDIEILAFANRMGYKIIEMPVVLNFSRNGHNHSKIKVKTIFNMILETLKIRKRVKKFKPL
ncbi:MAG: glycosyltransferase family 2 protein [Eubacterium sp.]|nr:glycosyltransferase family 2 protein [Eubacterium sp.]